MTDDDRAQGYEISLVRPNRIEPGEPTTFTYRFAANGRPLTELRPYLDAALHLAVVKEGPSAFLHEHGTAAGEQHSARHAENAYGLILLASSPWSRGWSRLRPSTSCG